jgi:hypothetical protein
MMNGMIRKAGHKLEITSTKAACSIRGTRNDTGETYVASFSVDDAKNAGLFKAGGGWDKYPEDMCFARALSRLARRLFPDVIGTAYVEGEIEDGEDTDKQKKSRSGPSGFEITEVPLSAPMTNEELKEQFYLKFQALETERGSLGEFLNTRPDPYDSMRKALSNPEQFGEFIPKIPSMMVKEKDKKQAEKTKAEVMKAMQIEAQPMTQAELDLEMQPK